MYCRRRGSLGHFLLYVVVLFMFHVFDSFGDDLVSTRMLRDSMRFGDSGWPRYQTGNMITAKKSNLIPFPSLGSGMVERPMAMAA